MFWIKLVVLLGICGSIYGLNCHHYVHNVEDVPADTDTVFDCTKVAPDNTTEMFCFKYTGTYQSQAFIYKGCSPQLALLNTTKYGHPTCDGKTQGTVSVSGVNNRYWCCDTNNCNSGSTVVPSAVALTIVAIFTVFRQ